MEKIKFGNGQIFDLVPAGISAGDDMVTIKFQRGSSTLDAIRGLLADQTATHTINIVDEDDSPIMMPLEGYIYLKNWQELVGYTVDTIQVANPPAEGEEQTYHSEDVTADVIVATLARADVRAELAETKAQLEYVSMMTGIELEV